MKTLLFLVVLFAAGWFLMNKLKQNKTVQEIQQAPVQYSKSLQHDVQKAQEVADKFNKKVQEEGKELQKDIKEVTPQ